MLKRMCKVLFIFFSVVTLVRAENKVMSMGEFATELLTPVDALGDFINTGSLILGIFCFFSGFIQYLEYRKNNYTAPLSSVFALILPGIAFVALPFLPIIIGAGFITPQS